MKNLFFIVLATFVLSSCKKDVDELPEATQTGAHTLGARIKGELWVPAGFGIAPTSDILTARFDVNNSILIQAKNFASEPLEKELEIYIKNITGTGVYQLDTDTGPYPSPSGS